MSLAKRLMAAASSRGEVPPEAIDFNGIDNRIEKLSGLTGAADTKTLTIAGWIYNGRRSSDYLFEFTDGGVARMHLTTEVTGGDIIRLVAQNSAGSPVLVVESSLEAGSLNTFLFFALSVDLANPASRFLVVGDTVDPSPTWTTYIDDTMGFTLLDNFRIGNALSLPNVEFLGRFTHFYLDYTFRDLSVAANRRLFNKFSDDRGLVPQAVALIAALNPIIYMPLINPDDRLVNLGTGGDFDQWGGAFALSQRGPNQFNAVGSVCNSSQLDWGGFVLAPGNKKAQTMSFVVSANLLGADQTIFDTTNLTDTVSHLEAHIRTSNRLLRVRGRNSGGTLIFLVDSSNPIPVGVNTTVQLSFNLADVNKRHLIINGVSDTASASWATYLDQEIQNPADYSVITDVGNTTPLDGTLGEFWQDHSQYVDLDAQNLFLNEDGSPAYLGEDGEIPTGTSPRVFLRISYDNPGLNQGREADFTEPSALIEGARGGSEYWSRSITTAAGDTANTFTNYLIKSGGLTGAPAVATGGFHMWFYFFNQDVTASANTVLFSLGGGANFSVEINASNQMVIAWNNVAKTLTTPLWNIQNWGSIFLSYDGSGTLTVRIINVFGTVVSFSFGSLPDIPLDGDAVIMSASAHTDWKDSQSAMFFALGALDITDRDNRLMFVDGLWFPRDLTTGIQDGDLTIPLVYMQYEDIDALGANHALATGGDFTINGTIDPEQDALSIGELGV